MTKRMRLSGSGSLYFSPFTIYVSSASADPPGAGASRPFEMTDVHDKKTRSFNMSRIRSRDTKPELLVRKFLYGF
jgi:hypothetical protein